MMQKTPKDNKMGLNNNTKGSNPSNTNYGLAFHVSNGNSKPKKVYDPCKHCGKTNHLGKNYFKVKRLMAKAKKKTRDSQVALCASIVFPNNSSSNMEWIMDSGASKHMIGDASLFTSYDNCKHISQKVSIGDGKQLYVIGSDNVMLLMVNWKMFFMFNTFPLTYFLFIVLVKKGLNLKHGLTNMFLRISIKISK